MPALAKRLRMAHRRFYDRVCGFCHQAMADRHKMLGYDAKARFREQKVNVRNAAMQRVFYWNDGARRRSVLYRINGVFERKTGQGQAVGIIFQSRQMRVCPRRALKGNRFCRKFMCSKRHVFDNCQCRCGITVHRAKALG